MPASVHGSSRPGAARPSHRGVTAPSRRGITAPSHRGVTRLSCVSTALAVGLVLLAPTVPPASAVADRARATGAMPPVGFTATFPEDGLELGTLEGYDTVGLDGSTCAGTPGSPALPGITLRIALPEGFRATGVRIIASDIVELPGEYVVLPCQPPRPIGDGGDPADFVGPDPAAYRSTEVHPRRMVELLGQTDLAGQSMAVVRFHPVRYVPATESLELATRIEVAIEGEKEYECGDYLPARIPGGRAARLEDEVRRLVANPEDVVVRERPGGTRPTSRLQVGAFRYVIVTDWSWIDEWTPLADWRTKRGAPSTLVSTNWIYAAGYPGSQLEQIRAFIEDAHASWGAVDFLLGADTHVIPFHVRTVEVPGYSIDDIPNDTYFADYDDDWICEVNVGRVSARSAGDIAAFIDKTLTYEKSPPLGGYVTSAAFLGFDIATCGDMHGESSKERIRTDFLPPSWSLSTEYDSEPGLHRADVLALLAQGHHLVNHHDHCNDNCMGVGWICHSDLIFTSDIQTLMNGDRQSILFAVGCNPCDFSVYRSIGETFVQSSLGGGVAFMGDTRTGWGGPAHDPDLYTVRQDRFFFRNLFEDGFVFLGENFSDLKNDEYDEFDPVNLHEYCFTQLTLLGDPQMPVWTEEPRPLTVAHPAIAFAGLPAAFPVEVTSEGEPVDGAIVCLSKADDVYDVAETAAGVAAFAFTPASPGTLHVTVTAPNYLPHEGQAIVTDDASSAPDDDAALPRRLSIGPVVPNPFGRSTEIGYAIPADGGLRKVTLRVYDASGRLVRAIDEGERPAGKFAAAWDGRDAAGHDLASGVYFVRIDAGGGTAESRVVLLR